MSKEKLERLEKLGKNRNGNPKFKLTKMSKKKKNMGEKLEENNGNLE